MVWFSCLHAGASIHPEAMMHFPPVSDFPLFSKNFKTFWKISKVLPKISHFHPPKFWRLFFSHRPQISDFPPYFACFSTFPLWFAKISFIHYKHLYSASSSGATLSPPTFQNFPKIQQLFTYFTCISPLLWPWCIYASPNARTGHPCLHVCKWHVLEEVLLL